MDRRTFTIWLAAGGLLWTVVPAVRKALRRGEEQAFSAVQAHSDRPLLFYVSTQGNDRWSGRQAAPNDEGTDGPFATLLRARDAIRELKRQQGGQLQQRITVLVREGTYFLSEPLVFTPEDSGTAEYPIRYEAYPNEKPTISGGRPITNWQPQGKLWVAQLPDVQSKNLYFRLLRVGDDWAIRARYPNFDPNHPLKGGWLHIDRQPLPEQKGRFNAGVARIHNRGDQIKWSILVPAAGNYRVWVRYAHNMKDYGGTELMDDRTGIRVGNSAPVPLRNLPDTGSFASFRWTLAATIELSRGRQQLVWQNLQGGGINFDAFCLTDDPNWDPATAIEIGNGEGEAQIQPPQPGKHLIIVHAETFVTAVGQDLAVYPENSLRDRLPIAANQFPNWQNWEGAEVNAFMKDNFSNSIFPVSSVDQKNHTLLGNFTSGNYPIAFGNRFFIENVREALDSPGEWYLDPETGELLYWPVAPDFPKSVDVVAPTMDRLIGLQGDSQKASFVEHIQFHNLTFADTNYTLADKPEDAAIWFSTARNCAIENCRLIRVGGYGIRMEQRSHENRVVRNTMAHLGQGGVILLGNTTTQPYNNLIAANDIHDCGKVYKHVAGVFVDSGSGNRIAHNRINRVPRYGISLKSGNSNHYSHNNIVEFNEIIDSNLETSDTGAIETLGRDQQPSGNIIRFNFIRNVVGMGTTASGKILSPYFTWGIYLDDFSSGTTVYGNIVINTTYGGIHIHGGQENRVENNIFVDGTERQVQLLPIERRDPGFMKENVFRRNIVVYKDPKSVLFYCPQSAWRQDVLEECDFNLYWQRGSLNLAQTNREITPEGSFKQWQIAGFDLNSRIADPQFVDLENGDFRLKQNSPAFRLGFQQIPIEKIGIAGFTM